MTTLSFHLPDMSCGHCARAVTEAVQALDAQARVVVDLPAKRAEVDSSAAPEALAAALTEAGYPPAPAAH